MTLEPPCANYRRLTKRKTILRTSHYLAPLSKDVSTVLEVAADSHPFFPVKHFWDQILSRGGRLTWWTNRNPENHYQMMQIQADDKSNQTHKGLLRHPSCMPVSTSAQKHSYGDLFQMKPGSWGTIRHDRRRPEQVKNRQWSLLGWFDRCSLWFCCRPSSQGDHSFSQFQGSLHSPSLSGRPRKCALC